MKLCHFEVGADRPFFLMAGPCVVESLDLAQATAGELKEITSSLNIPFIYKSSFDKANLTILPSLYNIGAILEGYKFEVIKNSNHISLIGSD